MWTLPWIAFFIALFLTYFITPLVRKLAFKYGAVAVPRDRDVHKEPLPRWGGLAMVASFLVTLAIIYAYVLLRNHLHGREVPWDIHQHKQFIGIVVAVLLITVVGAIDDKFEVSAIWQTIALVGAGWILAYSGARIEGITNPFYSPTHMVKGYDPHTFVQFPGWFSYLGTIIWVFGVAKTVDFIDGLDGLAAGVCAISAATLALLSAQTSGSHGQYEVTIMAATIVGICVGFLRYNFNPATIIMGTVGAQFLGLSLASMAVIGTIKIAATVSVFLPLMILGIPIFDGIRVVATRIIKRTPAYLPDKTSHFHHILLNKGLSQKRAVWVIYSLTAGLCLIAFALFRYVH